jgi:glucose/arabinose dehydrogenase
MRFTLVTAFAASALMAAIACGSSDSDPANPDGSSGGASSSGVAPNGSSREPPGEDAKAPPVPKDFPLVTPSVGGYKLEAIYDNSKDVYVPAAIVWPKVAGAPPFVLERMGQIVRLNPTRNEVLDFSGEVHMAGEGGAVGMTLHPQFGDGTGAKPYAYVWFNATGNKQRLVRWTWSATQQKFDAATRTVLVEVSENQNVHNGGRVAFGPDGFLYFGNGDDITAANHQTITNSLFAGIFRIDVDMQGGAVSHAPPRMPTGGYSAGYFIPNDNPFVGQANANEEYYALGLRNPFSFSFDRQGGQLWAGDVGDSFREEVNQIVKGGNYEWPYKEAELVEGTSAPTIGTVQGPKYFYTHSSMGDLTAVFGGFVYRGKALPELVGKYVYSDWPSSRIWALDTTKTPATRTTLVDNDWGRQPLALAEDEDGEIYMAFLGGISKLVRDTTKELIPKTLTETKIWKDLASATLNDEFVPYEINSTLWSDGLAKKRFISVPAGKQVTFDADGKAVFPVGTRFVKMFDLPDGTRRIEVRILVVGDKTTYGLTYKWNATGTDGDLVTEPTDETFGQRTWHIPSFGECWSCHRSENRVLGFTQRQLNLVRADGKKQLDALAAVGIFDATKISTFPEGLPKPSDTTATLEARALAYLAANCSGCHHDGNSFTGGQQTWRAEPGVPLASRGLIDAPNHNYPMAKELGLGSSPLIDPGNPANSILLARIKATDERLRMPPLGRNMVDPEGAALIEAWIASMP